MYQCSTQWRVPFTTAPLQWEPSCRDECSFQSLWHTDTHPLINACLLTSPWLILHCLGGKIYLIVATGWNNLVTKNVGIFPPTYLLTDFTQIFIGFKIRFHLEYGVFSKTLGRKLSCDVYPFSQFLSQLFNIVLCFPFYLPLYSPCLPAWAQILPESMQFHANPF